MRKWADRLDSDGAPKLTGWWFTHEKYLGTVFRQDGRGCRVAYLGESEIRKASDEDGDLPATYWRRHTNWFSPRLKLEVEHMPDAGQMLGHKVAGAWLDEHLLLPPGEEYRGPQPQVWRSPEKPWDHS